MLPGRGFLTALSGRADLDLALLPAESVNADGRFVDDVSADALRAAVPVEIRLSYHFTDALAAGASV